MNRLRARRFLVRSALPCIASLRACCSTDREHARGGEASKTSTTYRKRACCAIDHSAASRRARYRGQYDLRYKLERGDVLRYEVTHKASIRSTIDKTTQTAQTKTDSVKAWKVHRRAAGRRHRIQERR